MKTILVTGATGVLAKSFISRFDTEYRIIRGLRNPTRSDEIRVDSWHKIQTITEIDVVLHFAGKYLIEDSSENSKMINDAVVGTATVLTDYCRESNTPLISLGSYFELAPKEMQPWSYYAIAKQSAARILELASLNHDIPMRYLYTYDTYGNDFSRRKIVDVLLDTKTEKLELSPGEQKLNLTHENDLVDAINLSLIDLISNPDGFEKRQIRNQSDEFSLRQIAELVNEIRLNKISLNFGMKPYRKKEVFSIWDCAPDLEGWEPKIRFEDFVSQLVGELDD
jgi:nucleoside-diphosphate-sugar epimerase